MRQYFIISILALVIFAQLAQSLFGAEYMSADKKAACRTKMTSFLTEMRKSPENRNMTKHDIKATAHAWASATRRPECKDKKIINSVVKSL